MLLTFKDTRPRSLFSVADRLPITLRPPNHFSNTERTFYGHLTQCRIGHAFLVPHRRIKWSYHPRHPRHEGRIHGADRVSETLLRIPKAYSPENPAGRLAFVLCLCLYAYVPFLPSLSFPSMSPPTLAAVATFLPFITP